MFSIQLQYSAMQYQRKKTMLLLTICQQAAVYFCRKEMAGTERSTAARESSHDLACIWWWWWWCEKSSEGGRKWLGAQPPPKPPAGKEGREMIRTVCRVGRGDVVLATNARAWRRKQLASQTLAEYPEWVNHESDELRRGVWVCEGGSRMENRRMPMVQSCLAN